MKLFRFGLLSLCFFSWSFVWADGFCVVKSGAILRSQPKSSAPMSWKVPKYMPLAGTGTSQGSWVEVIDVDGQKHWANRKDLSGKIVCAVVSAKKTKLRKGPGNEFEVSEAGVADRYSTFLDHGGEDGWTSVENEEGQKSWIHLDHLWKPRRVMRMSFDE